MSRFLACIVLVTWPVLAHAGTFDDPPIGAADLPFKPLLHLSGGFEMLGGDHTSVAFRAHALVGGRSRHSRYMPSLAFGATLSDGQLYVDSPLAVDGTLHVSMWSIGPEVMSDVEVFPGGLVYASLAAVKSNVAYQEMAPPGGWGARAGLGINLVRAEIGAAHEGRNGYHEEDNEDFVKVVAMIFPQQFELTYERDPGSSRAGFCVSWGL